MAEESPASTAPRAHNTGRRGMAGTIIFAFQPIVLNAISLPVTAYIIRRLGPTAYGEWAAANALITVLAALTSMGLRGQYIRAVAADPARAPALTAEQFGFRFLLSLIATAMAVLVALAMRYPPVVVACTAIAGVGLLLNSVSTTATDLFQASHRLPLVAAIAMTYGLLLTIVSAVVVWSGGGPVGLAFAYLTGPAIWMGLSIWVIQTQDFPVRIRWSFRRLWGHLRESRFFAAQQLIGTLGQNAESLTAPALVGMTRYGVFSAGTMLASRLAAIPDGLATALYPLVARQHGRDPEAASREVGRSLTLLLALCTPLCILALFIADPIARILFPGDPALCRLVIRITAWSLPLTGIEMILGCSLNAAGGEAAQMRASLLSNILSFAVSVTLIYAFGLVGACVSYVVRSPIGIAFRLRDFLRTFRDPMAGLPLRRIAACNLVLLVVLWWLQPALWAVMGAGGDRRTLLGWVKILAGLALEGGTGMVTYGLAAMAFGLLGNVELAAIARRLRLRFLPGDRAA